MRILGIDPGFGRLGYGVIDKVGMEPQVVAYGVISTKPSASMPERLGQIYLEVGEIIEKHAPDCVASERQIFSANKTTALDVAKSLGVVMLLTAHRDLQWSDYTPAEVKMAVTGNGSADKSQVEFMVGRLLNLEGVKLVDDAADALAIALCHEQHERIRSKG